MVKRNPAKEQNLRCFLETRRSHYPDFPYLPPSTSMFFSDVVVTTRWSIFGVPSLGPSHGDRSPKKNLGHRTVPGTRISLVPKLLFEIFWDHSIWAVVVVELFFLEGRFGQEEWELHDLHLYPKTIYKHNHQIRGADWQVTPHGSALEKSPTCLIKDKHCQNNKYLTKFQKYSSNWIVPKMENRNTCNHHLA